MNPVLILLAALLALPDPPDGVSLYPHCFVNGPEVTCYNEWEFPSRRLCTIDGQPVVGEEFMPFRDADRSGFAEVFRWDMPGTGPAYSVHYFDKVRIKRDPDTGKAVSATYSPNNDQLFKHGMEFSDFGCRFTMRWWCPSVPWYPGC